MKTVSRIFLVAVAVLGIVTVITLMKTELAQSGILNFNVRIRLLPTGNIDELFTIGRRNATIQLDFDAAEKETSEQRADYLFANQLFLPQYAAQFCYAFPCALMCHRPWIDRNLTIRESGQRFSCKFLKLLRENHISAETPRSKKQLTVDDIVFVTYASSNHFEESRAFIANVEKEFPKNRVVYYDLGLTEEQVAELKTQCQIEYRQFDFHKYPPHVGDLMTYAFKTIITGEAYKDFELFWVVDASIRPQRTKKTEEFVQSMWNGTIPPFCTPSLSVQTTTQMTHFGMYRYLPTAMFRSDHGQFQAIALIMRSPFAAEVLKWTFLCALTQHCIAPLGSFVKCEYRNKKLVTQCHRYDQSAINIVLRNVLDEIEYRHWKNDLGTRFGNVFSIGRNHVLKEPLKPTTCNRTI